MTRLQKEAQRAAEELAGARERAAACRGKLFALAPPDAGASDTERDAWETNVARLRADAGAAEVALAEAEANATDTASRAADEAPPDGFQGRGDTLRAAMRNASAEDRELARIASDARVGRFMEAAMREQTLSGGVEDELRAAGGLADDEVPFELLDDGAELRADATFGGLTSYAAYQEMIVARVFSHAHCVTTLGCRIVSAGVGDVLIPVVSAGQSPEFKAKGAGKDAAAGSIVVFSRSPRRLTAAWRFATEDECRIPGFESTLRRDLSMSMSDQLDAQIIGLGDVAVRGLLATAANGGIADLAAAGATVDYAAALAEFARGVDGLHAADQSECAMVIRPEPFTKLATLVNAGSGATAIQTGMMLLGMLKSSANLPAPVNNVSTGILAKRGQGDRQNSYIPIWRSKGVRLIIDRLTRASEGETRLTAQFHANHALVRPAGFNRVSFKTA